LAQRESLLKGLHLSSAVLLAQLPRYWQTAPADFRKREYQLELGLLRYLTRQHFKTSPFSTFTAVGVSTLAAVPAGTAWPMGEVPYRSVIRLNNLLLAHLQTLLLVPGLQGAFAVRLNASAHVRDGHYHFLLNHRNLEAFQKLPAQALLGAVEHELATAGGRLPLAQLAQALADDYVDDSAEAVTTWLLQLVECGLLEFDLGTSGTDPNWDQALEHCLRPLVGAFPVAGQVRNLLCRLRELGVAYAHAPARDRGAVQRAMWQAFRETEAELLAASGQEPAEAAPPAAYRATYVQQYLQAETFTIRPYLRADFELFYEDAAQPTAGQLDAGAVRQFVQTLQQALTTLATPNAEAIKIAAYFRARYEPHQAVPLLEFYQGYVAEARPAAPEHTTTATTPLWQAELEKALAKSLTAYAPVLTVDLSQSGPKAPSAGAVPTATAAFVQFFTEANPDQPPTLRGVVNRVSTGRGKSSGRFLHLFEEEVTTAFQAWNQGLHDTQALAAELADASYSNANLHPPLLPHQVVLPGGHASHPAAGQLAAADLTVRSSSADALCLWHEPSGQRVVPYDVGLQALDSRAELYQFLAHFGAAPLPSVAPLVQVVGQFYRRHFPRQTEPLPGVFRYPRIELTHGVVLQRRRWYVLLSALPLRGKAESAAQYLARLADWRQQLELPAEVFFYLRPSAEASRAGADDYKPQYLHFESPLLVRLFEKQLPKTGELLLLEEMYPDTELLRQQAQHYVIGETTDMWEKSYEEDSRRKWEDQNKKDKNNDISIILCQ
jgi:hypothetical protein